MTFGITGQAEVLAQLSIDVDLENAKHIGLDGGAVAGDNEYRPVKWTLTKTAADGNTQEALTTAGTLNDALTAVNEYFASEEAIIEPGSTALNIAYTLSWKWELGEVTSANNRYDTLLGYAAMGAGNYEGGHVTVENNSGVITVTDNADAESDADKVVYTANTVVDFELTLTIMQIQTPAPVEPEPEVAH